MYKQHSRAPRDQGAGKVSGLETTGISVPLLEPHLCPADFELRHPTARLVSRPGQQAAAASLSQLDLAHPLTRGSCVNTCVYMPLKAQEMHAWLLDQHGHFLPVWP